MLSIYLALIDEPSDKDLFKEIYYKYRTLMKRAAYSILNNSSLTEDAVSETLLIIAKNVGKFRSLGMNERAALITVISRNAAINLAKRENRQRGGADTVSIEGEGIILKAEDNITLRENYRQILFAIKSLDAIYSDVLILKYVYGYDCKSISEMLGISTRTVESRIYRGKKMLAKMMEEEYEL